MPPTSQIVRNLAEEIRGAKVGKNWVGQFVKRYEGRLHSAYLKNIDNLRVAAEYAPMFIMFFTLVFTTFRYFLRIYSNKKLTNLLPLAPPGY